MSEPSKTSFPELAREKYLARGMTASAMVATIHLATGISQQAIWNAYRGIRVQPETAQKLSEWAFAEHGIEDLDREALVMAPARSSSKAEP